MKKVDHKKSAKKYDTKINKMAHLPCSGYKAMCIHQAEKHKKLIDL